MPMIKYTTQIDPHKTIGEIEKSLAGKARAIQKIYNDFGVPIGFSFMVERKGESLNFKIPIRYDATLEALKKEKIPERLKTEEQAIRVSWRILKDWILSQLVLIDIEYGTTEEFFFQYLTTRSGETLFEVFKQDSDHLLNSGERK